MNKAKYSKKTSRFIVSCIISVLFFVGAITIFAQQQPKIFHISPNNDGVNDELSIPISISDKRYISEWALIITDENGNIVRTIGNKEKRPETMTFKLFFKQLVTPKQGVAVPSSVTWNGVLDSGITAPDGKYFYYMTATDDNGNVSQTEKMEIWVDNTPPLIDIPTVSEDSKIFGAGSKSEFVIKQTGSVEQLWIANIKDVTGNTVRTFIWENKSPETVSWDGKDDNGIHVPDGVYTYSISSTDEAGNISSEASISNIIFTAEKPTIAIGIRSNRYFSPNGDKIQDTMDFDLNITQPQSKTGYANSLVNWKTSIIDNNGKEYRVFSGSQKAPVSLVFDGLDDNGNLLPEGEYRAVVSAKYLNGYEPTPVYSPSFVLDVTPPSVLCRTALAIFSPDGDGKKDLQEFVQEASKEREWKGEIITTDVTGQEDGKIIKTYLFDGIPSPSFTWDGITDNGSLASDGYYKYRLSATDAAGNFGYAVTSAFQLDTSATEIILTAQPTVFSPNGDKIQDSLTLTPIVKTTSGIASYTLEIRDSDGKIVRTISDKKALPKTFVWNGLADDGQRCVDGTYSALLTTISLSGQEVKTTTQPFTIDTVYPSVEVSVPYLTFSPNGDKNKDSIPFVVNSSSELKWTVAIYDANKKPVRTFIWQGEAQNFEWDGTDESGNKVPDGTYHMEIISTDNGGNTGRASIENIVIDVRETKAYVTAALGAFSPNGDENSDVQKFSIMTSLNEGIEKWSFSIINADTKAIVRAWSSENQVDVPASISWDGTTPAGQIAEGVFIGKLDIVYVKGDIVSTSTSAFTCTVTPPLLTVKTAPAFFSPDNDGVDDDLFISLKGESAVQLASWSFEIKDPQNGKSFWKTSGKSSITERIVWDGRSNAGELVQSAMDYPYTFTVTDELGMSSTVSGYIAVDVLVIKVGDVLKIQVPSIIFRGNNADFKNASEVAAGPAFDRVNKGLDQSVIDNNMRVIKRIAEILNKFKEYKVTIEGHANNVSGSEEEEITDSSMYGRGLVSLSQERADYVKEILVKNGVSSNRLSSIGIGGRQPVVSREDKDNWWKNRRVEFILNK